MYETTMKTSLIRAVLACCVSLVWPAVAPADIVGYVSVDYLAGDNLIGNPLSPSSNSIKAILTAPAIPAGATLRKWDTNALVWTAPSVFDGNTWSLDYTLSYGEGAWLHLPSAATVRYVGRILGALPPPPSNAGMYLNDDLASAQDFASLVGRTPREGESVQRLDAVAQTYFISTYTSGAWNNGAPLLNIGESAFFNLGPLPSSTISGLVELEAFVGNRRDVTFAASGGPAPGNMVLQRSVLSLAFTNFGAAQARQAAYSLLVPANTTHLSAKTAWHLRRRLDVSFTNNAAMANFTGASLLPAGDLDGSNTVDLGDYFILAGAWYTPNPAADLDGSGWVDLDDYFLLANRWHLEGDPE